MLAPNARAERHDVLQQLSRVGEGLVDSTVVVLSVFQNAILHAPHAIRSCSHISQSHRSPLICSPPVSPAPVSPPSPSCSLLPAPSPLPQKAPPRTPPRTSYPEPACSSSAADSPCPRGAHSTVQSVHANACTAAACSMTLTLMMRSPVVAD